MHSDSPFADRVQGKPDTIRPAANDRFIPGRVSLTAAGLLPGALVAASWVGRRAAASVAPPQRLRRATWVGALLCGAAAAVAIASHVRPLVVQTPVAGVFMSNGNVLAGFALGPQPSDSTRSVDGWTARTEPPDSRSCLSCELAASSHRLPYDTQVRLNFTWLLTTGAALTAYGAAFGRALRRNHQCFGCGYSLVGLVDCVCPECGRGV